VSSTIFSAELHPDPRLRQVVLGSGLLLGAIGLPLIASLGIALSVRSVLAAVWLIVFARQWLRFRHAYIRNGILRLDSDGEISCRRSPGNWEPLVLLPGSVVTSGWAWLRLSEAHGPDYAELLRGDIRQSHDWRRFQVIWRHIGASS
jgi:hypothetical protein